MHYAILMLDLVFVIALAYMIFDYIKIVKDLKFLVRDCLYIANERYYNHIGGEPVLIRMARRLKDMNSLRHEYAERVYDYMETSIWGWLGLSKYFHKQLFWKLMSHHSNSVIAAGILKYHNRPQHEYPAFVRELDKYTHAVEQSQDMRAASVGLDALNIVTHVDNMYTGKETMQAINRFINAVKEVLEES